MRQEKVPVRIDVETFERIFKEHYHALCLHARGFVGDIETAKNLVSELLTKFWEQRERIHINESVKPYLFRGVTNHCLKYLEHLRVERQYSERTQTEYASSDSIPTHDNENPLNMLIAQETMNQMEEAIDALPEQSRKLILLWKAGDSYQEIAEKLGIPLGSVGPQINRAIKKLRELIENKQQKNK